MQALKWPCFIGYSNTEKTVENTTRSGVFLRRCEMFRLPIKRCLDRVFHVPSQSKQKHCCDFLCLNLRNCSWVWDRFSLLIMLLIWVLFFSLAGICWQLFTCIGIWIFVTRSWSPGVSCLQVNIINSISELSKISLFSIFFVLVVSRFQAGVPPNHCSCLRDISGRTSLNCTTMHGQSKNVHVYFIPKNTWRSKSAASSEGMQKKYMYVFF